MINIYPGKRSTGKRAVNWWCEGMAVARRQILGRRELHAKGDEKIIRKAAAKYKKAAGEEAVKAIKYRIQKLPFMKDRIDIF